MTTPNPLDQAEQASNIFIRLLDEYRKDPVKFIGFTLFAVFMAVTSATAGIFIYKLYQDQHDTKAIVESNARPSNEVEDTRTREGAEINVIVNDSMEVARERLGVDRAVRWDGSNGQYSQIGIPWTYLSAGSSAIKRGRGFDIVGSQKLPAAMWAEVIVKVLPVGGGAQCARFEVDALKSSSLYEWAFKHDTQTFWACGVVNAAGHANGFELASVMSGTPITSSDEVIFETLRNLGADYINLVENTIPVSHR